MTGITPDGQAIGRGCVYPDAIKTLPDPQRRRQDLAGLHGRRILASPAYKKDGLIVINFDEGGLSVVPNPNGGF